MAAHHLSRAVPSKAHAPYASGTNSGAGDGGLGDGGGGLGDGGGGLGDGGGGSGDGGGGLGDGDGGGATSGGATSTRLCSRPCSPALWAQSPFSCASLIAPYNTQLIPFEWS
jgi:hypothetical protein